VVFNPEENVITPHLFCKIRVKAALLLYKLKVYKSIKAEKLLLLLLLLQKKA